MPFTAEYLNASFGSSRTGIGTVGYALMKNDGTVSVARTAAGVVEEGGGVYGKANIAVPDDAASILWDTGGGTPLFAAEDLEPARKSAELEAKLPAGNIASPGDEMALVDDAITSAKHDEATSFPLAQADTGASKVARTGADADTLETLSDQIDPLAIEANVEGHATDALVAYDPPTHAEMTSEHGTLSAEHAVIDANVSTRAAPGDAMTLTAGERDAIRAEIMTYVLEGNILGMTFEESVQFIRKAARNDLRQTDGNTDNLVLLDDDGSDFFKWDSRNKNGGPISQPTAAPARRIPS